MLWCLLLLMLLALLIGEKEVEKEAVLGCCCGRRKESLRLCLLRAAGPGCSEGAVAVDLLL